MNASNKSTALVDYDKAFDKCNIEYKQSTNDTFQVQVQSTESRDPGALNEGFIVEANYPNMSDKVISGSDITDSNQRSNNMGIKSEKRCDIVSPLKELGQVAVFTHTSIGDSWKSNCVPIHDGTCSNDKHMNTVLQKNCARRQIQFSHVKCDNFTHTNPCDSCESNCVPTYDSSSSNDEHMNTVLQENCARREIQLSDVKCDTFTHTNPGDFCESNCIPIHDSTVSNEKYINTVLQRNCACRQIQLSDVQCDVFKLWRSQSKYNFVFVPLSSLVMPDLTHMGQKIDSPSSTTLSGQIGKFA